MLLRPYQENDHPVLKSIYLQSRTETFTWLDPETFNPNDFEAEIKDEQILVAELDGKAIGFASVYLPENFVHLLFVQPGLTRQGAGKMLLNACVFCMKQPVRLKCMEKNVEALSFYQSQGWRIEEKGKDEYGGYFQMIYQLIKVAG